ncbi:MAG TPA: methionine biosynthesis protein MetW [Patescibacteria group bacterium]|nr:methionine biosynthesis protein MetW [Patescibacteria group bacterium]
MKSNQTRFDYRTILEIVEPAAKVLDLGCGDGDLIFLLAKEKNAKVQGIELSEEAIYKCVAKGLSVFHSDIDSGLSEYPDSSFDYVILNQTMQQVKRIDFVIQEALRVGGRVIVGIPNFAYWKARLMLCFRGRAPMTPSLPYRWYDTPNLRFLSINDFKEYCRDKRIRILDARYVGLGRRVSVLPNLFALNAIFVLSKSPRP